MLRTFLMVFQAEPRKCSSGSDIYALGIILFELFHPFQTAMERSKVLECVRDEDIIFPEECTPQQHRVVSIRAERSLCD